MLKHHELTENIIRLFYKIYNTLGYGFLEKVYERAMMHECSKNGLRANAQIPIPVYYDAIILGEYYADLLIEEKIIVELKATQSIIPEHEAQLLNYLKATNIEVGLLLNFGPKPEIRRKAFDNERKVYLPTNMRI